MRDLTVFHGRINHDNFGLAVLIFQLLFMGRHPFSGRYQRPGRHALSNARLESIGLHIQG